MQPNEEIVFKSIGNVDLYLHIFEPPGHQITDRRPAIVFFFGGGWNAGTPKQFFAQCTYLASRGMVAISAEYRVKSRHGVSPFECVTDGKSAIRWIRANAAGYGIDPDRIAAGGGSAGGHVAACTGTVQNLDEAHEDASISSIPNAMVLFNPALVLPVRDASEMTDEQRANLAERFGDRDVKEISPFHHVTAGAAPTLVLHGKADKLIPIQTAQMFVEAMEKAGNRCELVGYGGEEHGFFNFVKGEAFYKTMNEVDRFLVSLGYLDGSDTLEEFRKVAVGG